MKLKQNTDYITFNKGEGCFSFLPSGDIFEFTYGSYIINQFQGSPREGSANNLWLRIYHDGKLSTYPLLGISSGSMLFKSENTLVYSGKAANIDYKITFCAAGAGVWFWDVELDGCGPEVDILYGQDIGVAGKGGVLTNELYVSQYLDNKVFKTANGYLVCSRQNQPQGSEFPYLQQGMVRGKAIGYSTDGMQFFGISYRASHVPEALSGSLQNKNYQFECSYTALQTEKVTLNGKHTVTFYGLFKPDHKDAIREVEFAGEIKAAYSDCKMLNEKCTPLPSVSIRKEFGAPYTSPQWNESDICVRFPDRSLEERENGQLLSFFTEEYAHVALQQKELLQERPHGTIITSEVNLERIDNHIISSTNYIYGLFNGQTAAGNTSFHKFLSTPRGLLNILKNSGQRIYVRLGGEYRLLTLPSAFEMGMNFSRWYYGLPQDTLVITAFSTVENMDIALEVYSENGRSYDFIITNQLVVGENEFQYPVNLDEIDKENRILRITPDEEKWMDNPYPELHYDIQIPGVCYTWSDDRIFFEDGQSRDGTLLTLAVAGTGRFQLIIQGRLEHETPKALNPFSFELEKNKYQAFCKKLNAGFSLKIDGSHRREIEKLNHTAWWYTHNAMVHFAAPHGLEQPGGAAWGTRDICQGPVEFFLTVQNHRLVRAILLKIFSHQFLDTKEWPQWFMFDKYSDNAGECHGDVVLWPLKCIGDYLKASGDYAILEEVLPYVNFEDGKTSDVKETLLEHVKRAFSAIEARLVADTALISYAGGDWDDTLQPVNEAMKEILVSAWTVALSYQVTKQLGEVFTTVDRTYAGRLSAIAGEIKASFHHLLIKDGAIPGFALHGEGNTFSYLLHPSDDITGVHYRLLPMTRSIIAELVNKAQADANMELIDENLKCPDGVRLMDKPTCYDGGVSRFFRRAEQAANVGREISLQYTHAHIRYIEAAAKLGHGDRAWEALFQINPINIKEEVPNAHLRQSNMYFSSSDGEYADRYEYSRDYSKLRDGSVGVRGGWRLYSSGPGIYLHQLVSNVLGIRFGKDGLIIDPVLPGKLDGLRFNFTCFGRETTFVYHVAASRNGGAEAARNGQTLCRRTLLNPYRNGGILVSKEEFLKEAGEIHVYLT